MSLNLPRFRSMTVSNNSPIGLYARGGYPCHVPPLPIGSGGRDLRWFPVLNAINVSRSFTHWIRLKLIGLEASHEMMCGRTFRRETRDPKIPQRSIQRELHVNYLP